MKIFIAEDDIILNNELKTLLLNNGYEATSSTDYKNIVNKIIESNADLLLLDINLPYIDGFQICNQIRKISMMPILVVTSRNSDSDELLSLTIGADDFINKPYQPHILLAHIQSILRRSANDETIYKGLTFYPSASKFIVNGTSYNLTNNENKILRLLIKNKGKIVTRDEIMNELWQTNQFIDDNTLTVNMNRLRHKLEDAGLNNYLETKRGQGYII